jgi:hypothetical protein
MEALAGRKSWATLALRTEDFKVGRDKAASNAMGLVVDALVPLSAHRGFSPPTFRLAYQGR